MIKKTSKHPKDFTKLDTQERIIISNNSNPSPKKDIFAMPNIFLTESKDHLKAVEKPVETQKLKNQQKKQPITSREMAKKILGQKLKKLKRIKIPPKDLSEIKQSQHQFSNSSSQSDSILNESSIDYAYSDQFSQEFFQNEMDKSFIAFSDQDSAENVLDKTVVMSKKKGPRQFSTPSPKKMSQKELVKLEKFASQYSLDALQAYYRRGNFKQSQYLHILQLKKQQNLRQKQEKFNQNLQKVQNHAKIIDQNYFLIEKKLQKDLENDQQKIKDYTKKIIEMNQNPQKKVSFNNPQQTKIQLQTLQVIAELKAKQEFSQILKNSRQQFKLNYNQHISKIKEKRISCENFSQNTIFIDIKQFLNTYIQNYQYLLSSLSKNHNNEPTLISLNARKKYLNLLEQKYSRQLSNLERFKEDCIINQLSQNIKNVDEFQVPQQTLKQIQLKADKKISKILKQTKQDLITTVQWIRMVSKNGLLKQGKMFMQAVKILVQNMPQNISLKEQKQRYFIENFKFFKRKVFKKIESKFKTIQQCHEHFQTKKSQQNEIVQKQKRNQFQQKMNIVENCVGKLQKLSQDRKINKTLFKKNPFSKIYNQSNDYGYLDDLKKSEQKLINIQKKTEMLLKYEGQMVMKKKSLIPQKKVCRYNFGTQQNFEEQKEIKKAKILSKQSFKQKLESQFKVQKIQYDRFLNSEKRGSKSLSDFWENITSTSITNEIQIGKEQNKKFSEKEKKEYMNRVYDLIAEGKISKQVKQVKQQIIKPYIPLSQSQISYGHFSKIRFSHQLPIDSQFQQLDFHQTHIRTNYCQNKILSNQPQLQSFQLLNKNYSLPQVEQACNKLTRQFYLNPEIFNQMNLNPEQINFILFPQYRRHFLEKKEKTQKLEERILNVIKTNPYPTNQPIYQAQHQNALNFMIQNDCHFQQMIQEYQDKIVKHQNSFSSLHKQSTDSTEFSDLATVRSLKSIFDGNQNYINNLQCRKQRYFSQSSILFDQGPYQAYNETFQNWLSNRYD